MQTLASRFFATKTEKALLFAIGLTIFAFVTIDALHLGIGMGERLAYLLVILVTSLAALHALLHGGQTRKTSVWVLVWLLLLSIWLMQSYWMAPAYPYYVAGDFASLALPALLVFLISGSPSTIQSRTLLLVYVALLLAAALGAVFGTEQNRHEPPTTLLLASTAWWILRLRSGQQTVAALIIATFLSILIITSGQRTAFLIWLFLVLYLAIFAASRLNIRPLALMVLLLTGAPLALTIFDLDFQGIYSGHRLGALSSIGTDESLITRIEETQDVLLTIRQDGNLSSLIFGFGHGGTYTPFYSHVKRNITDEGRVHNIHITPIMIFFRYGLIGLLVYLWFAAAVISVLIREILARGRPPGFQLCLALASGGYLVEGLMFNVLVDPLFAVVGAFFIASLRQAEPSQSRRPGPCGVASGRSPSSPFPQAVDR